MPYPSKGKLQRKAAPDKKTRLHAARFRDAEPPAFAELDVPEIPVSQKADSDSDEQLSSYSRTAGLSTSFSVRLIYQMPGLNEMKQRMSNRKSRLRNVQL